MVSLLLSFALTQTPPSHCRADERAIMTCAVKKKVLSVCAGPLEGVPRWLQYRFGPVGRPELVFPASKDGSLAAFRLETRTLIDGTSTTLTFANAGVAYEVWTQDGRNGGGGVVVRPTSGRPVTVACTGDPKEQWDDVRFYLAAPDDAEADCGRAAGLWANRVFAESKGQMDGVQHSELTDAVKALCERDWPAELKRCVQTGGSTCPFSAAQRQALDAAKQTLAPP